MYKEIIKVTFEKLFSKWQAVTKALIPPLIILMLIEVYTKQIQNLETVSAVEFGILLILSILASVYVAVTTHRILLLGEDSVPTWGTLRFTHRELTYLSKTFLLAILLAIPIVIVSIVGNFFALAGLMIAVILFSRLSLVFPAISIDEPLGFKDSWELTKDYKFLTFLTLILFPAILALVVGFVYSIVIGFLVKLISPHLHVLSAVLDVFITVFIVGFLSSTYMYIRTQRQDFFEKTEDTREAKDIKIERNETTVKIFIDVNHNVNFQSLKEELQAQYEPQGFVNTAIDKEDSWMIKSPEHGTSYIHLAQKEDEYIIETYNTEEPNLKIMGS